MPAVVGPGMVAPGWSAVTRWAPTNVVAGTVTRTLNHLVPDAGTRASTTPSRRTTTATPLTNPDPVTCTRVPGWTVPEEETRTIGAADTGAAGDDPDAAGDAEAGEVTGAGEAAAVDGSADENPTATATSPVSPAATDRDSRARPPGRGSGPWR